MTALNFTSGIELPWPQSAIVPLLDLSCLCRCLHSFSRLFHGGWFQKFLLRSTEFSEEKSLSRSFWRKITRTYCPRWAFRFSHPWKRRLALTHQIFSKCLIRGRHVRRRWRHRNESNRQNPALVGLTLKEADTQWTMLKSVIWYATKQAPCGGGEQGRKCMPGAQHAQLNGIWQDSPLIIFEQWLLVQKKSKDG